MMPSLNNIILESVGCGKIKQLSKSKFLVTVGKHESEEIACVTESHLDVVTKFMLVGVD